MLTLNEALSKTGEAFVVIQDDGTETVYDNYFGALNDMYEVKKAPMTEERKEALKSNLVKARQTRSERAAEKKAFKDEMKEQRRQANPALYQKRLEIIAKARAARAANKAAKLQEQGVTNGE